MVQAPQYLVETIRFCRALTMRATRLRMKKTPPQMNPRMVRLSKTNQQSPESSFVSRQRDRKLSNMVAHGGGSHLLPMPRLHLPDRRLWALKRRGGVPFRQEAKEEEDEAVMPVHASLLPKTITPDKPTIWFDSHLNLVACCALHFPAANLFSSLVLINRLGLHPHFRSSPLNLASHWRW